MAILRALIRSSQYCWSLASVESFEETGLEVFESVGSLFLRCIPVGAVCPTSYCIIFVPLRRRVGAGCLGSARESETTLSSRVLGVPEQVGGQYTVVAGGIVQGL